jgi:mannose-6-phosphate isomerase-like protein (cupin superfamily)
VRHRTVEEIWYVVAGAGKVWRRNPANRSDDTVPFDVVPGDALTISTGWEFQFSASDDADLRFICYTSPPWPGDQEAIVVETGGLGRATVDRPI